MARTRHFTQSVLLAFAGQVIVMSAGLWLTPFLLSKLGAFRFGIWILAQQIFTYLTLLDIGVVALLPREIAYVAGSADGEERVASTVARAVRLLALQTPLVAAVALGFSLVARRWTAGSEFATAAIAVALLFPFRAARAVCEGLQDLGFIGAAYLIAWAAGFCVTVTLVAAGWGFAALVAGWAAMQGLDAALCLLRIWRRWRFAVPSFAAVHAAAGAHRQFARGMWMSISQLSQVLIYGTDSAIVGRLFGAAAIVPYSCTGKLMGVLANAPQHIMRAAEPGLSQMRFSESRQRLVDVSSALSLAMLLASGLVTVVCLAVNPAFVRWWVGDRYFSGLRLTALFGLSMMLRHLNITAIYTLFALGHEKRLAITGLADGFLSTVLSILFAWLLHSAAGVVWGSIVSTACILLFANGRKLGSELGVGVRKLAEPLLAWFWRMCIAGSGAYLLTGIGGFGRGPAKVAALALIAGATYTALMVPVALDSSLAPYIRPVLDRLRWRSHPLAAVVEEKA